MRRRKERMRGEGALVVLPTYDERENLPRIVPAILQTIPDAHVLVVDDDSPDGTGALADELAAADPRVHVLHRTGSRGLGTAYLAGFGWALARDYDYVFEMDADFSHKPQYLPDFLDAIGDHDLVLGCRYMAGGGIEGWSADRLLLSRGGNLYARMTLGMPFKDLTGGFKLFRREVLERIDLSAVKSVGYAFQIELTWRTWRQELRIGEVPIVFPDREAGVSKMNMGIAREGFTQVLKMRLGLL